MSAPIQSIPLKMIDGSDATLGDFAGKVLLLVNVASRCSFTPQYDGLELLCEDMGDRGFTVLGFPANDFAEQEPGDDEQITEFCRKTYSASFPMFSKIAVTGEKKHPLYEALTEAQPTRHGNSEDLRRQLREFGMIPNPDPELLWNFEKFVVARNGNVVGRFTSDTVPDDPALVSLIDAELRKS